MTKILSSQYIHFLDYAIKGKPNWEMIPTSKRWRTVHLVCCTAKNSFMVTQSYMLVYISAMAAFMLLQGQL